MGDCFALFRLHARSEKIIESGHVGGAKHSPILTPHKEALNKKDYAVVSNDKMAWSTLSWSSSTVPSLMMR